MPMMNKKGSVIFMYLAVAAAIWAIIFMYINFNEKSYKSTEYLTDEIMKGAYDAQSSMQTAMLYLDTSARFAAVQAAQDFETAMAGKKGCLLQSNIVIVNQTCDDPLLFYESYANQVENHLNNLYMKYPDVERILIYMNKISDFAHYYIGDKLFIIVYGPMKISNDKMEIINRPILEFDVPVDLSKLKKAYDDAKIIDFNCRGEAEKYPTDMGMYNACVRIRTGQSADMECIYETDYGNYAPLNSFMESWLSCVDYPLDVCHCKLPVNAMKAISKDSWIEAMKEGNAYNFRIIEEVDGKEFIRQEIKTYKENSLGNLHDNDYFQRTAIRMRIDNEGRVNIRLSEPPGPFTKSGQGWNQQIFEPGIIPSLIKFSDAAGRYTYLLTANEGDIRRELNNAAITSSLFDSLVLECSTETIYAKINNLGKVSIYDQSAKKMVEKDLDFVFAFKK